LLPALDRAERPAGHVRRHDDVRQLVEWGASMEGVGRILLDRLGGLPTEIRNIASKIGPAKAPA
jgi:hypothetical protein